MSQTATKKMKPLLFAVNTATGDVHTTREPRKREAHYSTCGYYLNDNENDYGSETVQITCEKCLKAYQDRFTWTVQFTVHPTWVADGFDLTDERALDMLSNDLQHANIGTELDAKVISAPHPDEVAMEMGYRNAADRKKRGGN